MAELEGAIEKIRLEIPEWRSFLNNVVPGLGFGFGLEAVQTENPPLFAFFAMLVLGAMAFSSGQFPRTLKLLRRERGAVQADRDYVRAIEHGEFSLRPLVRNYWFFLVSWLFLAAIFSGLLTSKGFTVYPFLGK